MTKRAWIRACLVALAACGATAAHAQYTPPAPEVAGPNRTSGEYLYGRHCANCHGSEGRGSAVGFPLVGRPAGAITPEQLLQALRRPLQVMPQFTSDTIRDDAARLIAHHVAVLENKASGAAVPPPPEVAVDTLRIPRPAPPAPVVAAADPASYDIREHEAACGPGQRIAAGPDGRVWYTGIARNALGMFDPKAARSRCWPIPTRHARPYGIAVDGDGFVWVTITGLPDNKIAMFDPKTELFTEFQLPGSPRPFAYPNAIAFDAERNPVFTLEYGDGAARIDRRSGRVTVVQLPGQNLRPDGIAVGRNGRLLVAENTGNRIAEVDTRSARAIEHVHPRASDDPGLRTLVVDPRGNAWFAETETGGIGQFEPRSKRWRSWQAPVLRGASAGVASLQLDARGNIWFGADGYIGSFDPAAGTFAVYPLPDRELACGSIDVARDGTIWCLAGDAARLVQLTLRSATPARSAVRRRSGR